MGILDLLFSSQNGQPMNILPPVAAQQMPPQVAQPDMGDRLYAGLKSFGGGSVLDGIQGFATGRRMDPAGRAEQAQNLTAKALIDKGIDPNIAQAAIGNPDLMHALIAQTFNPQVQNLGSGYVMQNGKVTRAYTPDQPTQNLGSGYILQNGKVVRAYEPDDKTPAGFERLPGGGMRPIPGGPADPTYLRSKSANEVEYGLNPIYGKDDQGNDVLGTLGKDGTFKRIDTGGVKINAGIDKIDLGTYYQLRDKRTGQVIGIERKDIAGAKREGEIGEAQGKAVAAAPGDIQAGTNALDYLQKIENHPYLDRGTGVTSFGNRIPGTGGYDFQNLVEQAKSGAFLQAIQQMRGLGSLSNSEGGAATAALNRMNTATSKEAFLQAVHDYRTIINQGITRAKGRLANPAAINPQGEPAVDDLLKKYGG